MMWSRVSRLTIVLWTAAAASSAQESPADRVNVEFSDPGRPGIVRVGLTSGGITVTGYSGGEVIVEARVRQDRPATASDRADGLRLVPSVATGLTVEEDGNVMKVSASSHDRTIDLTIQVPFQTSLVLKCVNDGDIRVEQVEGEIEVNNINGGVTLTGVSGSVVAHALNEDLIVTFVEVEPGKSMSFSSLNGDVDVTFPPDLKARLVLKSDQGEIYSDFEIASDPTVSRLEVEDSRGRGGSYRVKVDRTFHGTVNGGGPEMSFTTFNGDIFVRKAAQ